MQEDAREIRQWMDEMRDGRVESFDRFYERCSPFVYRLALKMTGNVMDAEDVCHDVLLEALHKSAQFDPSRGSVEAWLAVRTKSRCIDLIRKRQRTAEPVPELPEQGLAPNPAERVLANLEREKLLQALRKLPEGQREAVHGLYYAGKTQKELARELNRPLGTVKSFIRYGLKNVKRQLQQLGWAETSAAAGGDQGHGPV